MLRGSHSQLRGVVVRWATGDDAIVLNTLTPILDSSGSLQYYLVIIALNIAILCISRYGGVSPKLACSAQAYLLCIRFL
jgi:hypothetical protein